jgi:hypothetical protein
LGNVASFAPLWIVNQIKLSMLIDFLLDQNFDDRIVNVFFNIQRSIHLGEIQVSKEWELELLAALIQSLLFESHERQVSILICIFLVVSDNLSDIKELVQVLELKETLLGLDQSNSQVADIISEILRLL